MSRSKKAPNTLVARAMVEHSARRFVFEVHRTATFANFYTGYTEDLQTGEKRSVLPRNRTNAENLDDLVRKISSHIEKMLKRKVERTEVQIFRKRIYARLLKASPDQLGLVKLHPFRSESNWAPSHSSISGYTSLQTKMDILTGRRGRR